MTFTMLDADWNHWPEEVSLATIAARTAALELDGVEVGVYDPAVELASQRMEQWRAVLGKHGLVIGAILLSLPAERWPGGALGAADPSALMDTVTSCCEVAAELGLDRLGVWPGADFDGMEDAFVRTLREVAKVAADHGLRVALEPKPDTLVSDPVRALQLADDAGAIETVGVLLDTGHELAGGRDPAQLAAEVGEHLLHVHAGDSDGDADADLPAGRLHSLADFMVVLSRDSYDGAVTPDLYGCVADGVESAEDAVRESILHLRAVAR